VRPENHRAVREQLGAFALGQLDAAERVAVQAHLDGCPSCRAELNSIAPLAAPLRSVRPERIDDVPALPPGLGEAVMSRIRAEAGGGQPTVTPAPPDRAPWRTARRLQLAAAAAVIAIAAGGIGFGVGAQGSSSAPAPLEAVAVRSASPTVQAVADVVPHTWGVEIKLEATGFAPGRVYRVSVTDDQGRTVGAGEFVGTGAEQMRCNLNSSVLRAAAAGFQVTDPDGQVVVSAAL